MKTDIQKALLDEIDRQVDAHRIPMRRLDTSVRAGRRSRIYFLSAGPPAAYLEMILKDREEAFSADLLWSMLNRPPKVQPSLEPDKAMRQAIGALRIDLLWSNGGSWWRIKGPSPPFVTQRSTIDIFRQAERRIDLDAARLEIPGLVDEFLSKVRDYVLPYVAKLQS